MSTNTHTTETLIALAGLKGKLHDPADGPRYWGVDGSVPGGRVFEYSGVLVVGGTKTRTEVTTGDMYPWDKMRLAEAMNAAFKAAQAEVSA